MNYRQITWIASYPKSGNTWLRVFLEAFLRGGKYELNNLLCSVADDVATRYQVGDGSDCRSFPVDIQHLARPMSLLRLVRVFDECKPHPDMPLFVKTHTANLVANGVTMFPEQLTKCTVHIVRDPRDVAVSFSKHLGVSIDKAIEYMDDKLRTLNNKTNAPKVDDWISSWKFHTNSFVSSDMVRVKTFRYEDMLHDSLNTFSAILDHVGLDYTKESVQNALDAVDLEKLREKEKATGFIEASLKNKEGFFGKGGSTWNEVLTPAQAYRIEKMAGNFMKKFNYTQRKAA